MKQLIAALLISFTAASAFAYTFTAASAFAYTVILKSGKKIEGILLSEDESVMRFKDSQGHLHLFKKKDLDLEAMKKENKNQDTSKQNKVFTNEDMKERYGETAVKPQTQTAEASEPADEETDEEETYWERVERIAPAYIKELEDLHRRMKEAQEECIYIYGLTDSSGQPVPESGLPLDELSCQRAEDFAKQILEVREKARLDGVPLQWLENRGL